MYTNKNTARIVGVLFIIGTLAGVFSVVFTASILDDADYLVKVSENENNIIIGALFVLTMGFALSMMSVFMYPIFRKYHETLALGYVVFRGALEFVTYLAAAIIFLLLVSLSREYVKAGTPDAAHFETLGTLLKEGIDWVANLTSIVFSLGALMFYYLFYQTKLIPRWLSVWGLIGAILYLAVPLLAMFGTQLEILFAPLAVQEMVLAVWLIVKGFTPSAPATA